MFEGYSKDELIHIVDIYNLNLDMETLKKSKKEIIKKLSGVPKKKFIDKPLPKKSDVKLGVKKDKLKKNSLLSKVNQKNKITNYIKK